MLHLHEICRIGARRSVAPSQRLERGSSHTKTVTDINI